MNSISQSELRSKFKPVDIPLEPWTFRSSIKLILRRRRTQTGKVVYIVQFNDGQIAKVSSKSLNQVNKKLVEEFDLKTFQASEEDKPVVIISPREKRKLSSPLPTPTGPKRRAIVDSSEEDHDNTFELENEEDDNNQISISGSEEEELDIVPSTRSRRMIIKPSTFKDEFYPMEYQRPKKPASSTYFVPPYTNDLFVGHHSTHCFRCYHIGSPKGPELVKLGQLEKRSRLLLCNTCSMSVHNNCASQATLVDKKTGVLKCQKCANSLSCAGCNRDITNSKDSKLIPFRCFICFRAYHFDCIASNVSSELADRMKNTNMDEFYKHGKCLECSTFPPRVPEKITAERMVDGSLEYMIKWKDHSYRHTNWVSAKWLSQFSAILYRGYLKRRDRLGEAQFSEEWKIVDRILDVDWISKSNNQVRRILAVFKDTEYGEAVWDDPPTKEETELYPDYELALKRYILSSKVPPPKNMKSLVQDVRRVAVQESYQKHELKRQPSYIQGGTLMKHQMDALNWLIYQWEKKQSCILADDMGLGKTIQIISFLYHLYKKFRIYPFFIVVPNSTATNWIRECEKWAPALVVAPYFGSAVARKLSLENEILDHKGRLKCHVVVATYESALDGSKLRDFFWPVMIVDESQRLKNDESLLFRSLRSMQIDHIVLLTGTPLQNNLRELLNIMNFIRPKDFHGTEAKNYEDMTITQVEELHSRLRPHFLRRTKEEVLKNLPPKYELIVPVSMTTLQKEVYKQCLSGEIHETLSLSTGVKRQKGLSSIMMNLRKNLNHPYLLDGVETAHSSPQETQTAMIEACAKLKLFHQMLPKLREKGHRILLFSTMTRTLDLLEDYFFFEKVSYVRIDGSTRERERVRCIDAFNAPKSNVDVFLLSTRAGGVGINLATADTIIIWDSDFNPYADLQAIGRAHRIGQRNMVLIYRFMTRLTIEEKILQIGKKKMALEHVVVERMKADEEENLEDIESILKFGTEALFSDDDSKDITYDTTAIEGLLDREQYREIATEQQKKEVEELEGKSAENGNMNFSFAKVWQADGTTEELPMDGEVGDQNDTDFWEKFLVEQQEQTAKKKEEKRLAELNLGRGARKRNTVTYKESMYGKNNKNSKDDEEYLDDLTLDDVLISEELEPDVLEDDTDQSNLGPKPKKKIQPTLRRIILNGPASSSAQTAAVLTENQIRSQQHQQWLRQQALLAKQTNSLGKYKKDKLDELMRFAKQYLNGFKHYMESEYLSDRITTEMFNTSKLSMFSAMFKHTGQYFWNKLLTERDNDIKLGLTHELAETLSVTRRLILDENNKAIAVFMENEIIIHARHLIELRAQKQQELELQQFQAKQIEKRLQFEKQQEMERQKLEEKQRRETEKLKQRLYQKLISPPTTNQSPYQPQTNQPVRLNQVGNQPAGFPNIVPVLKPIPLNQSPIIPIVPFQQPQMQQQFQYPPAQHLIPLFHQVPLFQHPPVQQLQQPQVQQPQQQTPQAQQPTELVHQAHQTLQTDQVLQEAQPAQQNEQQQQQRQNP